VYVPVVMDHGVSHVLLCQQIATVKGFLVLIRSTSRVGTWQPLLHEGLQLHIASCLVSPSARRAPAAVRMTTFDISSFAQVRLQAPVMPHCERVRAAGRSGL
jgi:hypothetical protein